MDKDIKLIALDMDGTLLNNQHVVSDRNKEAILAAREQGVEVIISTGRHYQSSFEIARELDIHYLITVNGSEIWTLDGELIARQTLDSDIVKKLMELKEQHGTWTWLASVDEVFSNEAPEDILAYEWLKVGFDTDNDHTKEEIIQTITDWGNVEWSNSSPTNIEINAFGVNKAAAIKKVCERLDLSMEQVMAAGDSLNDIKMIEKAGLGVAMGNAQQTVKDKADYITDTNENDGVAKAIEKWVLRK